MCMCMYIVEQLLYSHPGLPQNPHVGTNLEKLEKFLFRRLRVSWDRFSRVVVLIITSRCLFKLHRSSCGTIRVPFGVLSCIGADARGVKTPITRQPKADLSSTTGFRRPGFLHSRIAGGREPGGTRKKNQMEQPIISYQKAKTVLTSAPSLPSTRVEWSRVDRFSESPSDPLLKPWDWENCFGKQQYALVVYIVGRAGIYISTSDITVVSQQNHIIYSVPTRIPQSPTPQVTMVT